MRVSPQTVRASAAQAETQAPQAVQRSRSVTGRPFSIRTAPCGQTSAHFPQPVHFSGESISSGRKDCDSGFWHQRQRRGQPLKNTVVRMPGPSWME